MTWAVAAGKPDVMLLLLNKLMEDGNVLYKVKVVPGLSKTICLCLSQTYFFLMLETGRAQFKVGF